MCEYIYICARVCVCVCVSTCLTAMNMDNFKLIKEVLIFYMFWLKLFYSLQECLHKNNNNIYNNNFLTIITIIVIITQVTALEKPLSAENHAAFIFVHIYLSVNVITLIFP